MPESHGQSRLWYYHLKPSIVYHILYHIFWPLVLVGRVYHIGYILICFVWNQTIPPVPNPVGSHRAQNIVGIEGKPK